MQNYVKSLDFESTPKSWFYDKVGDKYFLVRLIGFSNAYSVSLVDFDLVMAPSRLATQTHKTSSLVYLSNDGTVLNPSKTITENKLTFSPEDNNHIKKGQKENFFVVQDRLKYADITMLYLSPYQGSQFYLNATQMFAIIASVLALLLIPFMCFLAIKIYFSPLRDAIATMENIRNGKLNSKLQETQFIREFSVFNSTFNRMMGFTEEEVREMLTYYSTNSPFRHTVDELMEIMKPWYDNYCFAQDCYGETTMYNSNMVLYFVKNYIDNGKAPREMIEDNIRIDYEKLRMLIRKDKEFAHDASVIQTLVSQGYITGELKKGFPAVNITNPDNFISLLYYFGMLTISGIDKGKTKLTIPNLVVQEQLYTYLLNTYNDADLNFSSYEKSELSSQLAYDGNWQAYFGYIADCLKRYASQRDKQKGEFFVHGFTLAMTAQNRFYRPISEQDTQAGYVDIFLCPMLDIYSDMKHSYIVELKYAKYRDSENRVEELRQEAIAQANRYADTDTVKQAIGSTQLHKIVVVYKGMEMRVCEEL